MNFRWRKTYTIAPRVRTEIRYADDFSTVSQRVEIVINAITKIFEKYKNGETKQFSQKQFETELMKVLGEKVVPHDKISMLLDIFTESVDERAAYSQSRSRVRVLRARKAPGADETSYFVSNASYAQLPNFFIHQIEQCVVNAPDSTFFRFIRLLRISRLKLCLCYDLWNCLDWQLMKSVEGKRRKFLFALTTQKN